MSDRPNMIFIFTDQQRPDSMGCYGQKLNVTPHLDKMAEEGVIFTHAFSNQPLCGPTRSIIQTGKYATETGCFRNGISLPADEMTLAKILTRNGYDVAYTGKWHLASDYGGQDFKKKAIPLRFRGGYNGFYRTADVLEHTSHGYGGYVFDENEYKIEFEGYRVDEITNFALEYLENRPEDKPFFLFISYLEPHHQNDHNTFEGPEGYREKFENFDPPADLEGLDGDWPEEFANYLACCHSIDENVGRIQQKIEELGLTDNTIFIYTSDHGCHFRTRVVEYKRSCHDSSIHVPLIIKGPGFEKKKITDFAQSIDMVPTVLDIAGIEHPNYMRGISMNSVVEGNSSPRDEVFIQICGTQIGRALRTKRWKYSVRAPLGKGFLRKSSRVYIEDYLYDLEKDPEEHHNLVANPKYKGIRTNLMGKLISFIEDIEGYTPKIYPKVFKRNRQISNSTV